MEEANERQKGRGEKRGEEDVWRSRRIKPLNGPYVPQQGGRRGALMRGLQPYALIIEIHTRSNSEMEKRSRRLTVKNMIYFLKGKKYPGLGLHLSTFLPTGGSKAG